MRQIVNAARVAPLVRQTAASIVRGLSGVDGVRQARTIREWITEHVTFLRDPHGAEALHAPVLLLRAILTQGSVAVDCDDVAMLSAALGKSIGLRARFVVVGFRSPQSPFRHVWADLSDPRFPVWVDMDVTRPLQGLSAAKISRSYVTEV